MRGRLLMDAALARAVRGGGGAVWIHPEPLPVEAPAADWRRATEQSHRWLAAILRGLPPFHAAGFVWLRSGPLLAVLIALAGGPWLWPAVAALATRLASALALRAMWGARPTPRRVVLQAVVDLAAGLTWIAAALAPRVTWRGRRWRVGRGARVTPLAPGAAPRSGMR
jgi:uncharacterized RDD family membrane protein YckC